MMLSKSCLLVLTVVATLNVREVTSTLTKWKGAVSSQEHSPTLKVGPAAPPTGTNRRIDVPENSGGGTPITITAVREEPSTKAGFDYTVPNKTLAGHAWAIYDFTLKKPTATGATAADRLSQITILMDRTVSVGDPDVYFWLAGEDKFLESDLNNRPHGMHQITHTIDWNVTVDELQFKVGVYAYSSTATYYQVAVVAAQCPTGVEQGKESKLRGAVDTKFYPKVCGNPYHPTAANPQHGSCQPDGTCKCMTYAAGSSFEGTFVLDDCTGVFDPVPIFPHPKTQQTRFDKLSVNSGFDNYYNITVTDETYEVIVDMSLEGTGAPGNMAVMSIAVDRYSTGDVTDADFYPDYQMRHMPEQTIRLSRTTEVTERTSSRIKASGSYIIRVQWVQNTTAGSAIEADPVVFALAVNENQCPGNCGGTTDDPNARGKCNAETHVCTCNVDDKGTALYSGVDCSITRGTLVPHVYDMLGSTIQVGTPTSSMNSGGTSKYFNLNMYDTIGKVTGPAELVVTVEAVPDFRKSHGAYYWCNSVPEIYVSKSRTIPASTTPITCQWKTSTGPATWVEKTSLCGSQFVIDSTHDHTWWVSVLANGYGDMAYNITATVTQTPSTKEFVAAQSNVSSLKKELTAVTKELGSCEAAAMAGGGSAGSSGTSGVPMGAFIAVSAATFLLGAALSFFVGKSMGGAKQGSVDLATYNNLATPSSSANGGAQGLLNA